MATYIGTTQAKSSLGKIWFAVVAFAVAAAIVIALGATQQGGSPVPRTPDREHTLSRLNDTPTRGGYGQTLRMPHRS